MTTKTKKKIVKKIVKKNRTKKTLANEIKKLCLALENLAVDLEDGDVAPSKIVEGIYNIHTDLDDMHTELVRDQGNIDYIEPYTKKYDKLFDHVDSLLSQMSTLSGDIYDIGLTDRTIVETLQEYYDDTSKLMDKLEK